MRVQERLAFVASGLWKTKYAVPLFTFEQSNLPPGASLSLLGVRPI